MMTLNSNDNSNNINSISMMQDPKNSIDCSSIMKSTGFLQQAANLLLQLAGGVQNLDNLTDITGVSKENVMPTQRQRVIVDYNDDGTPIYKQIQASSANDLNDRIVQSYIESGRIWEFMQGKKPKSKTLFREYAEKWIAEKEKKLNDNTIKLYRESLKVHILPVFGECYIEEITRDDIQKFMDDRSDYAKSSVELHWTLLKNILDLAIDDEIISKNVAKSPRLHNPATRVEKREALTEAQMADIASNLYKLNVQDQCMIALMLTIGGRRGEICGLRWEHIDFENNQVHIVQQADLRHKSRIKPPKNNSIGTVGLPQWVKEILLPYREKEGYIIYARKGKPLSESTFIKRMKRIEETINLYGASAHVFRHSAITALFHNGADTSDVQGFARHKNHITTLNIYVHPRKEKVIEYRNVFDNIVNKDACFA